MQLAEVSLALGAIEDQVLCHLKYVKIPQGNTVQNVVMWHLMSFPHLVFSRFFQKREKFRKPEKLKRTSAQDSMTSLRNSKQSRLNSRKSLLMLITPKRRSRWVNCPGLTVKEMLILLVCNAKLNYNPGCEIRLVFISFSQCLAEDLDSCGRTLSELDAAVQEFGRRNPLLAKQLGDAISKLSEMHHHTTRLADCRNNWLKKVYCFFSSTLHRTAVVLFVCFLL